MSISSHRALPPKTFAPSGLVTRIATNLVHVRSVVVLSTGETSTSRMLPVLADTTVTGRDVSTVLPGVGESGGHSGVLVDVIQVG